LTDPGRPVYFLIRASEANFVGKTICLFISALVATVIGLAGCARQGGAAGSSGRPKAVDRYVLAEQAHRRGDDERAIELLEEAVRDNPQLIMAQSMLGELYRANSVYAPAADHYASAAQLDPYTPEGHYKLGLMYQLLNQLQDSAAAYLRALKLDPNDVPTNMNLGLVYLALGQPDDAVYYIDRAVQLDPRSPVAWANLGVALDAQGEFARAESAYRKSLDLDPNQTTTRLNLGTNLISQKKGSDAVSVLQQVVREEDTALSRRRLGDALAAVKQYEEAIREYERAIDINPRYYPALNEMGRVHIMRYRDGFELDDAQRLAAIDAWQRSLKVNPQQPRVASQVEQWTNQGLFGN
jgi:superkiller protein 3